MEMKKNSVRTAAIVGAMGSLFIFSPMGREMISRIKAMFQSSTQEDLLVKAGNPDPEDIGDNNMVNEGAMYSVHYYNKNMDK